MSGERKLPSWIDGFITYTSKLDSPTIWRRWTAIYAIAAALERKVWVETQKGILYPNIYTTLVGPPGAGKTLSLGVAKGMLTELNGHHVAPSNVSRASLIDSLNEAERSIVLPKYSGTTHFNSLAIMSTELGVLLPAYENDFMSVLTDIYDGYPFSEKKRTAKTSIEMKKPQLNMIAATTPSYLNNFLPEGAWEQGFMSRMICIYSGATAPGDIFKTNTYDKELEKSLTADLKIIGEIYGPVTFDKDAAEALIAWHMTSAYGGEPIPDHPKLQYYNTRRTSHLLKLCMIASAARSNELFVSLEDYVEALEWLTTAEAFMPDIFKAMRRGGDSQVMDETWHFAYTEFMRKQKPVPAGLIIAFLAERTPAHNIERILEVMCSSTILKEETVDYVGRCFVPKARRPGGMV